MSLETYGDFEGRVRASFARQGLMETFAAEMVEVSAGATAVEFGFADHLTQQHGYLHAGVITSVMDSAAGFAALTVMPEEAGVLTVELKSSLMRPAAAERFRVEGRVIKPGRSIVFTEAHAYGLEGGQSRLIAHLTASMMVIEGRDGVSG